MWHTHTPILNTTPHALTFACLYCPDGTYSVPCSGVVISATAQEEDAGVGPAGVELVRTTYTVSPETEAALTELEQAPFCAICQTLADPASNCPACGLALVVGAQPRVIIGSIIAAQVFPGRVLAMVSIPGFERVPPEQKRMNPMRFTTFA